MAEAPAGFDLRRMLLVGGVVLVVIFSALFLFIRGCSSGDFNRNPGYSVIYSNLDLKDAANVVARLKELKIPYNIREGGKAIAVPKDKVDESRLGLAEKNLPIGGSVGWEIFDETKMGATDFDRRIQLIRAISGELARTIKRIEGIEDVRVQVVIPETKLFAVAVAPVTASVLLRLRPGFELIPARVNGIVHLVASSVENLQTENVTVIDDSGRILSTNAGQSVRGIGEGLIPPPPPAKMLPQIIEPEVILTKEAVAPVKKEEPVKKDEKQPEPKKEASKKEDPKKEELKNEPKAVVEKEIPPGEKIVLKTEALRELERDLSGKAQELLNRFYPPNSSIVKVSVAIQPMKEEEIKLKDIKIKKLNTVILIDNRIDLTAKLKQATFTTVAAAVGHNKKRGDILILQKVPFHLATPAVDKKIIKKAKKPDQLFTLSSANFRRWVIWGTVGFVGLALLFWLWSLISGRGRREEISREPERSQMTVPNPPPPPAQSGVERVRNAVEQNPEKIADLLKKWLSE
ncbi:flagellar M-ring protein FliF [candidate division WOR-1 bacterium RIFOXYA12_FULL_52_29]|uniref:Flagellar M-ring protein FliF n=1 Tax=candidate division WOR-1 bacterium RIFOXYC12_FULL_54_18 TaxID=1802584 RepID=A0A1F4T5R4_UNCSA|nr:MAG: flagellar M-ring protein FliF [candidate division WOR-1 bacterium RIFOXYA2_FULL_51_19]OGC17489.1 MAG: flagellar M-ring protein FliF [candidate division WOR-1 bacterium RIFOXYA12_FULL_52_29]OGC26347.1 MAG: flagellar M-ring protein FliF [candidate division WOR-1 bacterium RIFOXYB2_FULL_45_9]OGC27906.1 MAG: flagellar M-ring protein FliF [candidate division WOR-1 bacterium RIFOXYC12_FULL_54_18]OGC29806.1 MAG: flagellar M-ring protein FliF [candidate division WOR-1 bacterium RIFOXYB12_FULL_5